jgi:hypothetical protein
MILHLLPLQRRLVMFDKIGDAAERLATNVSRRNFLGWAGKSALALAGAVAGLLA